jgi:nuclear pore complex protein Nup85
MPPLNHFLDLLQSHPSSFVKPLATRLRALAERLPRATIAPGSQFAVLKKQWNQLLASFRSELESLPASQKEETWWQSMNDIVHVFEGDEMTIRRICREHGLGWLELICVWGLWGDDTLERHHMP